MSDEIINQEEINKPNLTPEEQAIQNKHEQEKNNKETSETEDKDKQITEDKDKDKNKETSETDVNIEVQRLTEKNKELEKTLDLLNTTAEKYKTKYNKLVIEVTSERKKAAIQSAANDLNFIDVEDVYHFVNIDTIQDNDIERTVKELAKKKPHLLKTTDVETPKNKSVKHTETEDLDLFKSLITSAQNRWTK